MSEGAEQPRLEPGAVETIGYNLPCPHCGYNQRSLPIDGRCPECGSPVRHALGEDWLRHDSLAHVRRLQRTIIFSLLSLWLMHLGIASAFVVPIYLLPLPAFGGRPSPWSEILSFTPSATTTLAGLLGVLLFTSRIRVFEAHSDATRRATLRSVMETRIVGVVFLLVLGVAAAGGIMVYFMLSPGQVRPIGGSPGQAYTILLLGTIVAFSIWVHSLLLIRRIAAIEKRCKKCSTRHRLKTGRSMSEIATAAPVFIVLAWVIWLFDPAVPSRMPGMAGALIPAMFGIAALGWWLTVCRLHATRHYVAGELAAMHRMNRKNS